MPDANPAPARYRKRTAPSLAVAAITALLFVPPAAHPQTAAPQAAVAPDAPPIVLREGLAIAGVAQGGRRPFVTDAVQALLVSGKWQAPHAGDKVRVPDGAERTWEAIKADESGAFTGRALAGGGYLYATVNAPEDGAALLNASGHGGVYVNGELRMGNPYEYGYSRIPVKLRRGVNHFLFTAGRGKLTASLLPLGKNTLLLNLEDPTLPDLIVGETQPQWGAVIVVNASDKPLADLHMQSTVARAGMSTTPPATDTALPTIPPWSTRKVGFQITSPRGLTSGDARLGLTLVSAKDKSHVVSRADLPLRVLRATDTYKRTFLSQIDGSVQYYAVNPAQKPGGSNALILSLHGASVEALGQAQAYGSKDWATLVAPTNRRPFGFDWEDWGRLDAMEVLKIAEAAYPHDPARVSLTGHSMGGHGTWSVGSLFPDRFAALGPSAGWISFATYAGGAPPLSATPTATETLLARGTNLSDTLARGTNLLPLPIYIVHGDADDNVPVEQARQMVTYLAAQKHPHVEIHEEKGAGHWWDASPAPGADCVDWAPMFAQFKTARIPAAPDSVDFTTPDPAVSAQSHWVRIEQQEQALIPSRVRLTLGADPNQISTISGTTENVHPLTIFPDRIPNNPQRYVVLGDVELDRQKLSVPGEQSRKAVHLTKSNGRWKIDKAAPAGEKSSDRGSGFKSAFRNRFVLLYGTRGTAEENAWAFARARYDAEAFWYRGNGSCDVLPDSAYKSDKFSGRNVILYGNADTHGAWRELLGSSPIQVKRGTIQVGKDTRSGDDLACLFLRPRPGTRNALVGAVSGSGLPGLRLTDRLPVFVSGVVYPDWVIADTTVLADTRQGVVGAGYFGNDWKVDAAQSAWRP